MDYYMLSAVRKDTNSTLCNAKAQMIDRIKEAFEALPWDTAKVACSRFRSRIKAVLGPEEWGFFEGIVFDYNLA